MKRVSQSLPPTVRTMFGKLSKIVDKAAEKANDLKTQAIHKVNAQRDFTQLRDLGTEISELRTASLKYFESIRTLVDQLSNFLIIQHALAPELKETLTKPAADAWLQIQPILDSFAQVGLSIDALLKEESAARKAAGQGVTDEAFSASRLPVRHEKLREIVRAFLGALAQFDTFMHAVCGATLHVFEQNVPTQAGRTPVPWEELWDEPRPATGASSQKPAPGRQYAQPWEELSSFSRPVDGDTRAKYAKQWNASLAGVIDGMRDIGAKTEKYILLVKKVLEYCGVWCQSDMPTLPNLDKVVRFFSIFGQQYDSKHLPEFRGHYDQSSKRFETHTAAVPQPGVPLPTGAQLEIPRRRCQDVREASIAALGGLTLFHERGVNELRMFTDAMLNAIGQ